MDEMKYVLDADGNPVPEPDPIKWGEWFERSQPATAEGRVDGRLVARTELSKGSQAAAVSSVFLGLDHGWGGRQPVLWEMKVFGSEFDGDADRATNRDEVITAHVAAVRKLTDAGWTIEQTIHPIPCDALDALKNTKTRRITLEDWY